MNIKIRFIFRTNIGKKVRLVDETFECLDDNFSINIDNENKIQIKNHEDFMIKATCPDHLCIKQGKINKKGATIVCLPHHLVVEVIEGNEGKEDGKVY